MKRAFDNIRIPVSFETKPEKDIPLVAFLFSRSGKLLERTGVYSDLLEFKTAEVNPRLYRIFIAPAEDKKIENIATLAELERFKPYELVLDFNPDGLIKPVIIPGDFSLLWLLKSCRVRGRVIKNFTLNSISQDRGICHARVHICEVDRIWWWINRIPDHIILRIPEIVITPEWPMPIPEPDPIDPIGPVIANVNPQMLQPRSLDSLVKTAFGFNAASEVTGRKTSTVASRLLARKNAGTNEQTSASSQMIAAQSAIFASPRILNQLNSANATTIRKTIVDNFSIFHPYFCYIPWLWPYFYRCDEVAVVYTDLNGAFDTTFWYWNDGDKPDLYFWVECLIDGEWVTVYKPAKPCNTYWDYACGSSVTIRVTDPRVRWECNDIIDGDIVWIKTIGNSASVTRIQQTDLNTTIQGVNFNHIGLSDFQVPTGLAANSKLAPFGHNLHFIVQFGSSLPSNGMYYYRWSYRKLRSADLSTDVSAKASLHQGQALYKSYTYEYYDAAMHKHIGVNQFKLGPVSVNGQDDLYHIPPVFPSSAPVNAPESSPLWDQNTLSVNVDSSKFSDGLYEFYLELFDVNGNLLSAIPKHLFQVPHATSFSPSIDAPDNYLVLNGSDADAYRMKVRIDNSSCSATVYKVKVDDEEVTSDCCGFVAYPAGADIGISFRAYHPNNLARFEFVIKKGTCDDDVQEGFTNASGMVIGDAGYYARDLFSIYRHNFSPAQLLSECVAGGKAAFAEHVRVYTLATNGYGRLNYLDDADLAAFALEPATP